MAGLILTTHPSLNERDVFSLFLKNGPTRPLFRLLSVFFKQTSIQFYNKLMWKNVHPAYGTGIRTHNLQNVSLLP